MAGSGDANAAAGAAEPTPYPLDTCIISGAKLGSMGEPVTIVHEGQKVKFCCQGCIETFRGDPEKYLKQIDRKAQGKATGNGAHEGHDHGSHGHQ